MAYESVSDEVLWTRRQKIVEAIASIEPDIERYARERRHGGQILQRGLDTIEAELQARDAKFLGPLIIAGRVEVISKPADNQQLIIPALTR